MLSKLTGQSGAVEFNAIMNEEVEMLNRVSNHAVEKGQDVSDHIAQDLDSIPLSGVIVGDDAPQKLAMLRQFRNNAELLTYVGRNMFNNLVIESLSTRHSSNIRDGFEFDLILKRIKIAQLQEIQITTVSPTQTNALTNKGRQQPKQKEPFFTFKARGS